MTEQDAVEADRVEELKAEVANLKSQHRGLVRSRAIWALIAGSTGLYAGYLIGVVAGGT
ncbi:hypothetical protein GCM10010451_68650 [Streptomyces virens]|uniref:Uncharacterized protein n=1 Tax=Streptomyces virens TaxID=285572 RepID=A0ABN3V2C0_9ACTN